MFGILGLMLRLGLLRLSGEVVVASGRVEIVDFFFTLLLDGMCYVFCRFVGLM